MLSVPAHKPRSVWRTLTLFFAALLTFGVLAPVTASAHGLALLRVHDKTVFEPSHGYTAVYVPITRDHRVGHRVSVAWYTRDGTAKAWRDYLPASGRVYFARWQKVAFAKVIVKAERHWGPGPGGPGPGMQPGQPGVQPPQYSPTSHSEFFFVKLTNPRRGVIVDGVGVVRIIEHRLPPPRPPQLPLMTVAGTTAKVGATQMVFTVSLDKAAFRDVEFTYETVTGGTAVPGTDFTAVPPTKGTIQHHQLSTTVSVPLLSTATAGKDLLLKVSNVHGADLPNHVLFVTAKGTITP